MLMAVMRLIKSTEFPRNFTVDFNRLWVRTHHLYFLYLSSFIFAFIFILLLFFLLRSKPLNMFFLCGMPVYLPDFFNDSVFRSKAEGQSFP